MSQISTSDAATAAFLDRFEMAVAIDDDLLDQAFQVRYKVYCQEPGGYFPKELLRRGPRPLRQPDLRPLHYRDHVRRPRALDRPWENLRMPRWAGPADGHLRAESALLRRRVPLAMKISLRAPLVDGRLAGWT